MWFLTIDPFIRISVFISKLSKRQYCWRRNSLTYTAASSCICTSPLAVMTVVGLHDFVKVSISASQLPLCFAGALLLPLCLLLGPILKFWSVRDFCHGSQRVAPFYHAAHAFSIWPLHFCHHSFWTIVSAVHQPDDVRMSTFHQTDNHSWSCRTSILEGAIFHKMSYCKFLSSNP